MKVHQGQTLAVGQAHGLVPTTARGSKAPRFRGTFGLEKAVDWGKQLAHGSRVPRPNNQHPTPLHPIREKKQGSSRGKAHSVPSEAGNLRAFFLISAKHGTHAAGSNGRHGPRTISKPRRDQEKKQLESRGFALLFFSRILPASWQGSASAKLVRDPCKIAKPASSAVSEQGQDTLCFAVTG